MSNSFTINLGMCVQVRLLHTLVPRLQHPGGPRSPELYRMLLPALSTHGHHTLVLDHVNGVLERGVALRSPEWSSVVGNALEQLPTVDAERFVCTVDDGVVKEPLQCLGSVGAEAKARRLVGWFHQFTIR